jgi:hypothetical protein
VEPPLAQPGKPPRPVVGLDKPCRKCGQPIYFRYKGPIEGLCGRCTDAHRRAKPLARNSRRIGFFRRGPRTAGSTAAFVVVLLCLAAFAAYLVYRYVL